MKTLDIVHAVAADERSAHKVCDDALAVVESSDGKINAFTARTADRARAEADAIDAMRGEVLPPLAGLPYAVKNLFDVEGLTTLAGSIINRDRPTASEDAVLIRRLKDTGAVLLGALNMDEFAYGFTTENSHYGPTRNPRDITRTAGGSSGGSGAAVASGQVPLALSSDTNGSIRVPSSLCGVWGLKPTFGRLSRRGTYPFVHSLDHLRPLADCVEGLALSYDAMQGPDDLDPGCQALRVQPTMGALDQGISELRIGTLGGGVETMRAPPLELPWNWWRASLTQVPR
ncbi:MAG: Oxamate carbamoyltransferase (EC [uncultured Paraburkholderia sp.]|nr:MAG: Oxamate carbamoyltransferase (EC [uncultured Paraburkholderia sp.]